MSARILSVNVGQKRAVTHGGQTFETSIYKDPVRGPVLVHGVNLAGDDQADREVHGGVDRAVYAYSAEDYAWWTAELGRELAPGTFGENLTVEGVAVSEAVVGERWAIGDEVELEVSSPRVPCYKLAARMDDPRFIKRFASALRPGSYLRITREGALRAGDPVRVTHRPAHGIRVVDVARIYLFDRHELSDLLRAPQLGAEWIAWIRKHLPEDATNTVRSPSL
jgi:MOSC domain-containing protein YiiM